jgi:hypothetical protein
MAIDAGITLLPPSAPSSVVATAGNASVNVTWLPPMDPPATPPVLSYEVRVTPGPMPLMTSGTATRASVSGLSNGIAVTVAVRARNVVGVGPWSAESNAVTPMLQGGLRVVSGGTQSAMALQVFSAPVAFERLDASGQPVANEAVTFSADPGVSLTPMMGLTDAQGRVSVTVRAGRLVGPTGVTATAASGASFTTQLTTTRPADGTLVPVTNLAGTSSVVLSPNATELGQGNAPALAVARDGTLYLMMQSCQLVRISRAGAATALTAGGGCPGNTGDGQPLAMARFDSVSALVLDEARNRLYVRTEGTQPRIRVLPLDGTSAVATLAGGGTASSAPGPGFGDNGPGPLTHIAGVGGVALSADGASLLFGDATAGRVRRVNLASPMFTVTAVTTPCTPTTSGYTALFGSALAVSAADEVVFFGSGSFQTCSASPSTRLFVQRSGVASIISSGTQPLADGQNAKDALMSTGPLAFDGAGNLLYGTSSQVLRIDGVTSLAQRLVGGGSVSTISAGPATSFFVNTPRSFGFDDEGTLYLLVGSNAGGVRAVYGADRRQRTVISLAASGATTQTVRATERSQPLSVTATVAGTGLGGVRVEWSAASPAAGFLPSFTNTSPSGIAIASPWMPRRAQALQVTASVSTFLAERLPAVPFTLTVVTPDAGVVSTLGNVSRDPSAQAVPGPAVLSGNLGGGNLDADDQGVLYVGVQSAQPYVTRIDAEGFASRLNVPGSVAPLVAWHRGRGRLYVASNPSAPTASALVSEFEPDAGVFRVIAGGGVRTPPLNGDGSNAVNAFIGPDTRIAEGPGDTLMVWDADSRRFRVVNLTSGLIESWPRFQAPVAASAGCVASDALVFRAALSLPFRLMAFDSAGAAFFVAGACGTMAGPGGTSTSNATVPVIVRAPPTGAPTLWAHLTTWPQDLALDSTGAVLWSNGTTMSSGIRRVYRIDPVSRASVPVVGNGQPDPGTDWSLALDTGLGPTAAGSSPAIALATLPQGRLALMTDWTVRIVW